jgi:hypothetical protein
MCGPPGAWTPCAGLLEEIGIEKERVAMVNMSAGMGDRFAASPPSSPRKFANWAPTPSLRGRNPPPSRAPHTLQGENKDMITAERKPLEEIIGTVRLSTGSCWWAATNASRFVPPAAARKSGILSASLQMAMLKNGKNLQIKEHTLERQCDPEYVEELAPMIDSVDAVLSMACGCGVQEVARRFKDVPVFPAVNTKFMGASERQGVWAERCQGCGDCVLGITGGICPIARCAKQLLNGPCGGSTSGKCEISPDTDCAWQLIWDRLKALGISDRYEEIMPAKDWRNGAAAAPEKSSERIWQNEDRKRSRKSTQYR